LFSLLHNIVLLHFLSLMVKFQNLLRTSSSLCFSELTAVAYEHSRWCVVITILLLPHCGELLVIVSNDVVAHPHLTMNIENDVK